MSIWESKMGRRLAGLATLGLVAGTAVWSGAAPVSAGDSAGAVAGGRRGAAASLSAGTDHTCALRDDSTISCWGSDVNGQVGNGDVVAEPDVFQSPVPTPLPGTTAKAIAVGGVNSCVLLSDNDISCWGEDNSGQIGDGPDNNNLSTPDTIVATPESVVALAVNVDYSCGLFASGKVRCWGSDDDGQLGNGGVDVGPGGADVDTASSAKVLTFPGATTASAVSAGIKHACAVLDTAQISCWGSNSSGQVGNGSTTAVLTAPVAVPLPTGRSAESVSAGGSHTCAVLDNESVTCWGSDASGQLGNGGTTGNVRQPGASVTLPTGAVAVATGEAHSCAVLEDDRLFCWGDDSEGQIGTPGANANATSPVEVLSNVLAVALGGKHTCALLIGGGVTCWGSDASGQLGNGAAGGTPAPTGSTIPGLTVSPNAGTPSAPRALSAGGGRERAELEWDEPIDDGGEVITGYRIQESINGGVTWTTVVSNTSSIVRSYVLTTATPSPAARYRVAAINAVGVSPYSQPSNAVVIAPLKDLKAFAPIRLLDTRSSGTTIDGDFAKTGPNTAGQALRVKIAGRGGAAGIPSNAPAAVLNLTSVNADPGGFATLFPCGDVPNASSLNFPARRNVANSAVAKLDDGDVCVFTNVTSHLIIDATGYVPSGSKISTVEPARVLDTRPAGVTIDGRRQREGALGANQFTEIQITGRAAAGIPAGADTVLLNLTAVNPSGRGFATVYPCGARPNSSSLNFDAGVNKANAVVAKLTSKGSLCVFTERTTNLLIDVNGYSTSATLAPVNPVRLLDTRAGGKTIDGIAQAGGVVPAGQFVKVKIAGRGLVPAGARLAALSVVAANPQAKGFLAVYPCTATTPTTSTLNYEAGQNVPNLALASLNAAGEVCIYSSATTHVLVDVSAAQ